METLVHDAELPITKDDCLEWLGDNVMMFRDNILKDQRIGQAWFNALVHEDQWKLAETLFDPFYRDDWMSVIKALMFLLEN